MALRSRSRSATTVRDWLIAQYEGRLQGRPWAVRIYGSPLERLRSGEPVILAGWQLGDYHPAATRGRHVFYQVAPDGALTLLSRDDLQARGWDLR